MLGGVIDAEAQVAAAPVKVERAGLEHGFTLAPVEIAEGDEIIEEPEEIAVEPQEFIDRGDGGGLGFERLVRVNEFMDGLLRGARQDLLQPGVAEFLDTGARFGGGPRFVGAQFGLESRPLRFRERGAVAQKRFNDVDLEGRQGIGPGGIDPFLEGKRFAGFNAGEGKSGDLAAGNGEIFGGERQVFLLLAVEGGEGAGVEGGKTAACEIIVDFGLERFNGGGGGGCGVAQW